MDSINARQGILGRGYSIVAWYKIAMLSFLERIFFSISCNY